jgi:hypothetical protein
MRDLIKQILEEETNLPIYFRRRVDSHKFEKMMRNSLFNSYMVSSNFDGFKNDLLYSTLEKYLNRYYNENLNDIDREEILKYVNHLESVFGGLLKMC